MTREKNRMKFLTHQRNIGWIRCGHSHNQYRVRKEIELNGNLILKTIYCAFGLAAIRYWVNKLQ